MSESLRLMRADVLAAGKQNSRSFGVRQIRRDYLFHNLGAQPRIFQAEHHLDTLINVPLHPIRAAEINLRFASVSKHENAAVLQKPSDHAAHSYPAADSANTRAQGARAAHDQLDGHACLRSAVERLDDFFVEQRVNFRDDMRGASGARVRGLPVNQADDAFPQIKWGHEYRYVLPALR